MAGVYIVNSQGGNSSNASQTIYRGVAFGQIGQPNGTTEAQVQLPYRAAGIFTSLNAVIGTNDRGASTVQFRVGGVNGNGTLSIGASATGEFVDTTHSDVITSGALVDIAVTIGAGGTTFTDKEFGAVFTPTTGSYARYGCGVSTAFSVASQTNPLMIVGSLSTTVNSEAIEQFTVKTAGTLEHLAIFCSVNGNANAATLTSRVGGAPGNLSISVGAGLTGLFEDSSHSDTLASGNLINTSLATGAGAVSLTVTVVSVALGTTNAKLHAIAGRCNGPTPGAGSTQTYIVGGPAVNWATDAGAQCTARQAMTASNLSCSIAANGILAGSTVNLRKNAGAGNETISIGAGATGYFEDTTHTDVVATTDTLNYQVVAGAGGTTLTVQFVGMLTTSPPTRQVSTAGADVDFVSSVTRRVSTVGTNVDLAQSVTRRVSTVGANVDMNNASARIVSTAGANVDFAASTVRRVSTIGLTVDIKIRRKGGGHHQSLGRQSGIVLFRG